MDAARLGTLREKAEKGLKLAKANGDFTGIGAFSTIVEVLDEVEDAMQAESVAGADLANALTRAERQRDTFMQERNDARERLGRIVAAVDAARGDCA